MSDERDRIAFLSDAELRSIRAEFWDVLRRAPTDLRNKRFPGLRAALMNAQSELALQWLDEFVEQPIDQRSTL